MLLAELRFGLVRWIASTSSHRLYTRISTLVLRGLRSAIPTSRSKSQAWKEQERLHLETKDGKLKDVRCRVEPAVSGLVKFRQVV